MADIGNDAASVAKKRYADIQTLGAELKQMKKVNPLAPFDRLYEEKRLNLLALAEGFLYENYDPNIAEDVEDKLWKCCWHAPVDAHRYRLKLLLGKTDARAKEEIQRLSISCRQQIAAASQFYLGMTEKFQKKYNLVRVQRALVGLGVNEEEIDPTTLQTQGSSNEHNIPFVHTCHRNFIYLGDLARYNKEVIDNALDLRSSSEMIHEQRNAAHFYQMALYLFPDNGNPHNQLAVMVMTGKHDPNSTLEVVYHYCRSLSVKTPSPMGRGNLKKIFNCSELNVKEAPKPHGYNGKKRNKKAQNGPVSIQDKLTFFIKEFLYVHSLIYLRKLQDLESLRTSTLRDFEYHLKKDSLPEHYVLQMMIINISSCNNFDLSEPANQSVDANGFEVQGGHKNKPPNTQKLALKFTVDFVQQIIVRALRCQNNSKFIASITTFFEWILYNPEIIRLGTKQDRRGWSSLWKVGSSLFTNIAASRYISDEFNALMQKRAGLPLLPEEIELRGFIHLEKAHDHLPDVSSYANVPITLSRQDLPRAMRTTKLFLIAKAFTTSEFKLLVFSQDDYSFFARQNRNEREVQQQGGSNAVDRTNGYSNAALAKPAKKGRNIEPVANTPSNVKNARTTRVRPGKEAAAVPSRPPVATQSYASTAAAKNASMQTHTPVSNTRVAWAPKSKLSTSPRADTGNNNGDEPAPPDYSDDVARNAEAVLTMILDEEEPEYETAVFKPGQGTIVEDTNDHSRDKSAIGTGRISSKDELPSNMDANYSSRSPLHQGVDLFNSASHPQISTLFGTQSPNMSAGGFGGLLSMNPSTSVVPNSNVGGSTSNPTQSRPVLQSKSLDENGMDSTSDSPPSVWSSFLVQPSTHSFFSAAELPPKRISSPNSNGSIWEFNTWNPGYSTSGWPEQEDPDGNSMFVKKSQSLEMMDFTPESTAPVGTNRNAWNTNNSK